MQERTEAVQRWEKIRETEQALFPQQSPKPCNISICGVTLRSSEPRTSNINFVGQLQFAVQLLRFFYLLPIFYQHLSLEIVSAKDAL